MPAPKSRLFTFKQFSLTDEGCAMKIGTDGLLLGAWAAEFASMSVQNSILDIGTGCGLVALMIAQKTNAKITAIDNDENACATAALNFQNSAWSKRLKIIHRSLQNFQAETSEVFNLVVCNPPYFENSLLSTHNERNKARHHQTLTFDELFAHSCRLMAENANLIIIYPAIDEEKIIKLARNYGLNEYSKLNICAAPGYPVKRIISNFTNAKNYVAPTGKTEEKKFEQCLVIEEGKRKSFTKEYILLTQDYHPFFE